jgi:hypothetical protein
MAGKTQTVRKDDHESYSCPIPMSHDRFVEAHYFLHEMLENYHEPQSFRYSANAFLSAAKSVVELLQMELQPRGMSAWLRPRRERLLADPILDAFFKGRNIALHQRTLFNASRVEVGLFRDTTTKLARVMDLDHDQPSEAILKSAIPQFVGNGKWLDKAHSEIGMQIGVRRIYIDPVISADVDVVTAAHQAWSRLSELLSEVHAEFGASFERVAEEAGVHDVARVDLLLESDLDPNLPRRWGWLD